MKKIIIFADTDYVVIDRGLFELMPYAKLHHDLGNMDDKEFKTYINLYNTLEWFIPRPNLIFYLHCSIDETINRVKIRSRDFEQQATRLYLEQGQTYYNEWFETAKADKKIIIDTTTIDLKSYEDLATKIADDVLHFVSMS